jgi:hypothetical protein
VCVCVKTTDFKALSNVSEVQGWDGPVSADGGSVSTDGSVPAQKFAIACSGNLVYGAPNNSAQRSRISGLILTR